MNAQDVLENVQAISTQFASERQARQRRRELVAADFDQLRDAGFLLTGAPIDQGGVWQDVSQSTRVIGEMLRSLAHGDSSVALVSAMHPGVLSFWLSLPRVSPECQDAWEQQRRWVFQTVCDGAWWGTITSEPSSGGDLSKTQATAQNGVPDAGYTLSGLKHFGSGSGISSYMITTALPEGESEPDWFFMNMREVPWDGSAGVKLASAWDGHGMTATQSHSMQFQNFPVTRLAWPQHLQQIRSASRGILFAC